MGARFLTNPDTPEGQSLVGRAQWFSCTRDCLSKKWQVGLKKWEGQDLSEKEEAQLTPAWDEVCEQCEGEKMNEVECCKKQVEAEQRGLQECMETCGSWKWANTFPLGYTPGWNPTWDFNDLEKRIQYGLTLCCELKEEE